MTDSTGPLDGWEFGNWGIGEDDCRVLAWEDSENLGSGFIVSLWNEGEVTTSGEMMEETPYKVFRAVLDELERRAIEKWGPGWGIPEGQRIEGAASIAKDTGRRII